MRRSPSARRRRRRRRSRSDLKRRGWKFVGAPTLYAFMQAAGLVNDHLNGCAARKRTAAARAEFAHARER